MYNFSMKHYISLLNSLTLFNSTFAMAIAPEIDDYYPDDDVENHNENESSTLSLLLNVSDTIYEIGGQLKRQWGVNPSLEKWYFYL